MSANKLRSLVFPLLLVGSVPAAGWAQSGSAKSPTAAVEEFIRAASDSNLTRMAELWGTDKGSASATGRPDGYGEPIIRRQAGMQGVSGRALGERPGEKGNRRQVTTEISRGPCRVTVPVIVTKVRDGWIVNNFDLERVADVNKPCEGSSGPGNLRR